MSSSTPEPGPADPVADGAGAVLSTEAPRPPDPAPRSDAWTGRVVDLAVILVYLALAVTVLGRLWHDPGQLNPAANSSDPPFFEWALRHAVRIFTHGENPFFTPRLNAPFGVNLMANTGLLGLTVPLVPVTVLFGPSVAFVLMITLGVTATAGAWYLVLSRHLVRNRFAAAVGGAFAGFAPGIINHTNAHPNLVAQFLLPVIVWRALSMRTVRHGIVLGLLITWQAFINEELLFLTVLATGIFVAGYAAFRPGEVRAAVRPFLRGGVAAAVVAGVLLAYPLWYQFLGPQHYHGLPDFVLGYGADLASYPAFAKLSLIGQPVADGQLAPQPEENTFLGWPLLLALLLIVIWLWRRISVRALTVVGLVFFALSLGASVTYRGRVVIKHAPWSWLNHLPLFNSVVPTRLGLVLVPVVAVLLGYAVEELFRARYGWVGGLALAVALVPVIPRQLPVAPRPPVPAFFTSGDWRAYLHGDRSLLSADTTWDGNITAMNWDNATGQGYRAVGGYFLGPDASGKGSYGPQVRPTSGLLANVGYNGGVPPIGDEQREQVRQDVQFWDAGLIVLGPGAPHADDLRNTLDQLVGPGRQVDDVWIWDVGALSG
ncbi:MAG TPA: hypothetical protein VGJ07_07575 [Rugosimonospora sp.]|jgi:hypothetical protein